MGEREETLTEGRDTEAQAFTGYLGKTWEERINGLLEKIPGFSDNGMPPEEKDLYRITLTLRIINATSAEMVIAGKGKLASFYSDIAQELARQHGLICDRMSDDQGVLPPEIKERLDFVREEEI